MIGQQRIRKQFAVTLKKVGLEFLFFLLFCSLLLCSCVGISDWEYELPNNYSIIRFNTSTIAIYCEDSPVLDSYVTSFAYNERFVCARRLVLDDNRTYFYDDIVEMDFNQAVYCIVDTQTHNVYDLLDENEFETLCKELMIENLNAWTNTTPKPKGAK